MTAAAPLSATAQAITPDLRQWLLSQAASGVGMPALVAAMIQSGWQEAVAVDAARAGAARARPGWRAPVRAAPAAVPVPEPLLEGSPLLIDAGDRRVEVLMTHGLAARGAVRQPAVPRGVRAVDGRRAPAHGRSLTMNKDTGGDEVNQDRTSDGMFFERAETPAVARMEERIAAW